MFSFIRDSPAKIKAFFSPPTAQQQQLSNTSSKPAQGIRFGERSVSRKLLLLTGCHPLFTTRALIITRGRYSHRRFQRSFSHPKSDSYTQPRTLSPARQQAHDPVQSHRHRSSGSTLAIQHSVRLGRVPLATRFVIPTRGLLH